MVSVRPTTRVLKTLNGSDKLPPRTAAAYRCATRVDDPDTQVNYLREAVSHAQEELALATYIQKRFDQGIFERHRSFADPIFESRDTARPLLQPPPPPHRLRQPATLLTIDGH